MASMDMRSARRNRRAADQKDKSSSRGGGRGRWFSSRWKMGPRPVRFHPQKPDKEFVDVTTGLKFPFKRGKRHFVPGVGNGKGRFVECSDQCLVCAYTSPQEFGFSDVEVDSKLAKSRPDTYYALGGWIEEWFHVEQRTSDNATDDDGKPRKYTVREICKGKGCKSCQDGTERVFGRRVYTMFSRKQWETVIEPLAERIERACQCGGYIYPVTYNCEKCEAPVIDVMNSCPQCGDGVEIDVDPDDHIAECKQCNTQWSLLESEDEDLEEAANTQHKCDCGHEGYPEPAFLCTEEECEGHPSTIYDVQFRMKTEGEDKQKVLVVTGHKVQEADQRLFDKEFQGKGEFAEKVAEKHAKVLDLDAAFEPESPSEQGRLLNKKNLYGGGHKDQKSARIRNYSSDADEADE